MSYIVLSYWDIAWAALLLVLNAVLSITMRLHLERQLLTAAARMVVQLGIVGLVLKAVFAAVSPWLTAALALFMVLFAGREVMARQHRRFTGWWAYGLGTTSIMAAALIVTVLALTTQVRPDPWYAPRYAIPLLGMILGNTMTGVSLGLDRLVTGAVRERVAIEAQLSLGHEIAHALRPITRDSLRGGLMPIVNSMAAAGVVSLPGMMTGQILAGVDPVEAVKYQLLIMFLISGGTGLGVLAAVLTGARRLTDGRHRLRLDRLQTTTDD